MTTNNMSSGGLETTAITNTPTGLLGKETRKTQAVGFANRQQS